MEFPDQDKKNPAYEHIDAETTMGKRNGTQAGDPSKGAKVSRLIWSWTIERNYANKTAFSFARLCGRLQRWRIRP